MAIVNTTPDSFSDGGQHADAPAATHHAQRCIRDGAALVDVGGESTRPGASRVPAHVQILRTQPVIAALAGCGAALSIDTTQADVARAALAAGAHIINDVSAGTDDPTILEVAAAHGCGLVLMHRRVPPDQDCYSDQHPSVPDYRDVVREVRDWLGARIEVAVRAGIARACIAVDPGLGFGKDVAQNFRLIAELPEIAQLGAPIVIGASRKSFIAAVTGGQPPDQRLAGSLGAAIAAAQGGASVLRVHDVAAHRHALAAWAAAKVAQGC